MRKITLLFLLMLAISYNGIAQDINFDPSSTAGSGWIGFMNVTNLPPPDGDGVYQFGSGWGVPDLIVIDNMDGTVNLQPNRIGDPDPYWQGGPPPGMLRGNKIMDANFFIEDSANLRGQIFTFNGNVEMNTLNNTGLGTYDFTVTAFIKVFNSDFSVLLASDTFDIRNHTGDFTVSMDATSYTTDENIQYGFQFIGPNIGIDSTWDAQYAALGSIVVGPNQALSIEEFEINKIKAFPNPTQDIWTIQAKSNIENIEVFDVLGKRVMSLEPNALSFDIDSSTLNNGIYFARVSSGERSSTIKLIKE